jgi:hypothetical protein
MGLRCNNLSEEATATTIGRRIARLYRHYEIGGHTERKNGAMGTLIAVLAELDNAGWPVLANTIRDSFDKELARLRSNLPSARRPDGKVTGS